MKKSLILLILSLVLFSSNLFSDDSLITMKEVTDETSGKITGFEISSNVSTYIPLTLNPSEFSFAACGFTLSAITGYPPQNATTQYHLDDEAGTDAGTIYATESSEIWPYWYVLSIVPVDVTIKINGPLTLSGDTSTTIVLNLSYTKGEETVSLASNGTTTGTLAEITVPDGGIINLYDTIAIKLKAGTSGQNFYGFKEGKYTSSLTLGVKSE